MLLNGGLLAGLMLLNGVLLAGLMLVSSVLLTGLMRACPQRALPSREFHSLRVVCGSVCGNEDETPAPTRPAR